MLIGLFNLNYLNHLVGGFSEIDPNSEEVQAAAAFSVEDYGPASTYEVVKGKHEVMQFILQSIMQTLLTQHTIILYLYSHSTAYQQVVTGMKYDLIIAIIEEPGMACTMNNFMVFKNLDQTYELLSKETLTGVDCPNISPEVPQTSDPDSWLCLSIYGYVPDSWFAALCLKEKLAREIEGKIPSVL
jgi:hypothetical protein